MVFEKLCEEKQDSDADENKYKCFGDVLQDESPGCKMITSEVLQLESKLKDSMLRIAKRDTDECRRSEMEEQGCDEDSHLHHNEFEKR